MVHRSIEIHCKIRPSRRGGGSTSGLGAVGGDGFPSEETVSRSVGSIGELPRREALGQVLRHRNFPSVPVGCSGRWPVTGRTHETLVHPMTTATATSPEPSGRAMVLRWIGTAAAALLGVVLLVAAWAKAIHPSAFAEQIRLEGLDFLLPAAAVAGVALALELGLGMLLLLNVRRLWVLLPAAALVAFFVFLTGRAYWQSETGGAEAAACGCFGNLVERSPAEAFWQDLALLVPPLLLAFVGRPRQGRTVPPVRTAVAALVTVTGLAFAWQAPRLPLDDLATRLRPGVAMADLCAGQGPERICMDTIVPEADPDVGAGGRHYVVMADLEDAGVGDLAAELNAYVDATYDDPDARSVWLVTTAGPDERQAFFWQHAPAFELRQAPETLLAPLYRRLPRSFAVDDGEVVATYDGLPPLDATAGAPSTP